MPEAQQGQEDTGDDFEDEDGGEGNEDKNGSAGGDDKKADEGDEEFDKDRALATIKAQREERKADRKVIAGLRAEMKKLTQQGKPEDEKLKEDLSEAVERADAAEARNRRLSLRTTTLEIATNLGFKDPVLAVKLIDQDQVDWDDDGEPTNIRSLLRDELKERPYLKGRSRPKPQEGDDEDEDDTGADAGAGRKRKGSGTGGMNQAIREAAGHA